MDVKRRSRVIKSCTPFITIGIASYNYAQYLQEAFEAIKRQSFKDFEVLYADDGSTDDSVSVIESIINENPDMDIRLISGKNIGLMGNKQRLVDNARGQYLMLCDADDWMLPDCLEKLCSVAKDTLADQIVGAFIQTDSNGRILQEQKVPKNVSRWTWGAHHGTLYKMSVIRDNNIRFSQECYPDDMYFNMVFHDNSHSFCHVDSPVYVWRMHDDSTSASSRKDSKWKGFLQFESSLSYIYPISTKYYGTEREQIEYAAIKMYCLSIFLQIVTISSFT